MNAPERLCIYLLRVAFGEARSHHSALFRERILRSEYFALSLSVSTLTYRTGYNPVNSDARLGGLIAVTLKAY